MTSRPRREYDADGWPFYVVGTKFTFPVSEFWRLSHRGWTLTVDPMKAERFPSKAVARLHMAKDPVMRQALDDEAQDKDMKPKDLYAVYKVGAFVEEVR